MTRRRVKGEGGLYQRHDHATCPPLEVVGYDEDDNPILERPKHTCRGRWTGTVEVQMGDGKSRRKQIYGRTQKEARAKLDKAKADREAGMLLTRTRTVEQWLTYWVEDVLGQR